VLWIINTRKTKVNSQKSLTRYYGISIIAEIMGSIEMRPATPEEAAKENSLPFTREQIEAIALEYPTPFFIYDEQAIRQNAREFKEAFSLSVCPTTTSASSEVLVGRELYTNTRWFPLSAMTILLPL